MSEMQKFKSRTRGGSPLVGDLNSGSKSRTRGVGVWAIQWRGDIIRCSMAANWSKLIVGLFCIAAQAG